ncbi:MAG: hypothetical protein AB1Z18_08540 [Desulfobacterales bacterium]
MYCRSCNTTHPIQICSESLDESFDDALADVRCDRF